MAHLAVAESDLQAPRRRLIRIAQQQNGLWQLSDSTGKLGGHFLTARAALQFVRLENVSDLICVDGLLALFDA